MDRLVWKGPYGEVASKQGWEPGNGWNPGRSRCEVSRGACPCVGDKKAMWQELSEEVGVTPVVRHRRLQTAGVSHISGLF